jgi:hypothetical protein
MFIRAKKFKTFFWQKRQNGEGITYWALVQTTKDKISPAGQTSFS